MKQPGSEIQGYIFACTDKTEKECFNRLLFSTNKLYGDNVLQLKKGATLFLYNMDKDLLYGVFKAKSGGKKDINPKAWGGKYPYQIEVEMNNGKKVIKNAKEIMSKLGVNWRRILSEKQINLLKEYINYPDKFNWNKLMKDIIIYEDEKPSIETTTLWDFPKQSYGRVPKGNNKYPGVTPAFIIYNMIKRYTEYGETVVDPMAGSGTTLDVCKEEGRKCICYDITPTRVDIIQNDARKIPLPPDSIDMVFIDSPYGDNIKYNEHKDDIGKISAEKDEFYDELEKVMIECHRILKPGKVLGWLIGDQWVKKRFTPVGFKIYDRLCKYFEPVDIVCVVRRNQASNTPIWQNRALRFNFFLRGFKYLLIVKKHTLISNASSKREIKWTQYKSFKTNDEP